MLIILSSETNSKKHQAPDLLEAIAGPNWAEIFVTLHKARVWPPVSKPVHSRPSGLDSQVSIWLMGTRPIRAKKAPPKVARIDAMASLLACQMGGCNYTQLWRYQLTDGKIKAQDINGLSAYSWLCWLSPLPPGPNQTKAVFGISTEWQPDLQRESLRPWPRSRDGLHVRYCKGTSFPQASEEATWCMVTVTCPFG